MKQIFVLILLFCGMQFTYAQTPLASKTAAKDMVKLWLKAFDAGKINVLQELSCEETTLCDLDSIVKVNASKGQSAPQWGKATWFDVRDKVVDSVSGLMVTASFDLQPGQNSRDLPTIQLFVYVNSNKKWVVDIYRSEFKLKKTPCENKTLINKLQKSI